MTRKETIEILKEDFPAFYKELESKVPNLLKDPENATQEDIIIYNNWIVLFSGLVFGLMF